MLLLLLLLLREAAKPPSETEPAPMIKREDEEKEGPRARTHGYASFSSASFCHRPGTLRLPPRRRAELVGGTMEMIIR